MHLFVRYNCALRETASKIEKNNNLHNKGCGSHSEDKGSSRPFSRDILWENYAFCVVKG